MEDIMIIEMYQNRNQTAISESNSKYGKMLRGISFSVLHNREDCEECVNDTYLNAWNSIPPQKPNSLSAYLGRIARNISINRRYEKQAQKRGGGDILEELTDCIPSGETVETAIEEKELSSIITKWLNSLSQDDRVLFLRRYWFGETLDSLAAECSAAQNKLAGRMFRLRQKLKSTLEEEGVSI